ncbi:MAG: hypothetical protein CMN76_09960 [Spirochaetaceae bacterium]|nr:hypothetical protein [Spirochaetaceae bacterium]|tara:strand:+ start:8633 stop:17182 length:8550 start_codon:yes stop_codon:yes gene_type:complete
MDYRNNKWGLVRGLIAVAILFSLPNCSGQETLPLPRADEGSIGLTRHQLESGLPLDGRWIFVQDRFINPDSWESRLESLRQSSEPGSFIPSTENYTPGSDPERAPGMNREGRPEPGRQYFPDDPDDDGVGYRTVPGSWSIANELDPALPADGRASYILKLDLPEDLPDEEIAIRIPDVGTAYRIYFNGQLLSSQGSVESDERTMTEAMRPVIRRIPADLLRPENEILFHIANLEYQNAGLWRSPVIGLKDSLEKTETRGKTLGTFLAGGLILIGIYHLGLFFARRKESAPLYFALFCISVAIWSSQSGAHKLVALIIDNLAGELAIRIEYIALYLAVGSFIFFAGRLYPEEMPVWPKRLIVAFSLFCSILGLILPLSAFVKTLAPMQITILGAVGLTLFWSVQTVRRKRLGAAILGASVIILATMVTNDVLLAMELFQGIYLGPYGLMFFIIGQSFGMSMKLSNAFNQLESLSQDLEARVEKRTEELDSLNELTRIVNESQDLDYIVGSTSHFLIDHLGMRRMFLFLIDPVSNEITGNGGQIADLSQEDRVFFESLRAPVNPELGTLYRTIQKKKSVYLDFKRTRRPEALIDRLVVEQLKMTSVVQIPVMVGEEVVGVATIDPGEGRLKRQEIPRLEAVVAQISGAVQKQLLLEKVESEKREAEELRALAEREKEESELLAELAREINRGASIDELLLPVARLSRERLGTSSLALYLEDENKDLVLRAGFYQDQVDDPSKYPEIAQRIPLSSTGSTLPRVHLRQRSSFIGKIRRDLLRDFAVDFALYEFWQYEWVALLPLLLKDRSIGLIAWSGPAADRISRKDLPLLERVADLITGAVENLNLLDRIRQEQVNSEIERQNSQTLAMLSRKAIEGDDLNTIVEGIYEPIFRLVGNLGIALYLPDPDRKNLEHRCVLDNNGFYSLDSLPASIRSIPLKPETGSLYWCFEKARSWYMPIISQSRVDKSPIDSAIQAFYQFSWCYHIPLVVNDEVIGIVTLAGRSPVSLTRQDRQFLERIVAQVAGAIRMQQLLRSVEQQRNAAGKLQRESRALADFTRLLNQRADLKSIVLEVCRFAVESLDLRGSYIMLVNEPEKEFQAIGGFGTDYGDQQALFVEASRIPIHPDSGVHYGTYNRKKTVYLPRIPSNAAEFDGFLAELFDLKSFALVPLLLDDRVIGIMGADPGQKRLSGEDLRKLETYADQVAGAINNGNLLKQVEDQRSSIEGLAEITQTAATTDNLEEILDQIFAYVYRRFGIASGIVLLPDSAGNTLQSYKAFSLEDMDKLNLWDAFEYAKSMRLSTGEDGGTLARTFARGKPFYVPDTSRLTSISRDYPGAEKDREILEHLNYRGYFALPMQVHGEPVALMIFTAYTEAFKLTPKEREELRTLADQLAGIIRSRQLATSLDFEKQQVEREKADSQVLANLARQANEGSNIESILREMAAYADSECGVQRLGLWLVDPDSREVHLHSVLHAGQPVDLNQVPEIIRTLPFGPGGGSVPAVIERNRKMYLPRINPAFLEASPLDREIQQYFNFDWLLHLPLSMEGTVLGVINFVGRIDRRPDVRQRSLLERMTSQIAGAVQSKQLVAEIQAERYDSEALAEVARRANEEPGISEIMEVVLKYAGEQCGVDTLCLLLVSPDGKFLSPRAAIRQGKSMDPDSVPALLREFPLSPESGTLYRVLERKESLYYPRITSGMERRMSEVDRAIRDYLEFHWFMDVPVMVHGQVLGALAFAGPERPKLSAREKNFLERITAQVSGAIYGKKLLDQVEKEKDTARKLQKETEGLNRLLKRIAPIEDLDEIMAEVLDYLKGTYGITLYSLYRADHDSQLLHPVSVRFPDHLSQEDARYIESTPIPFGEDAAGAFTMACRRSPRYTYYKGSRLKTPGLPEIERFVIDQCKLEMMVTFPLMDGDRMAAILNLSTTSEIEFSNDQLEQLSILSESISGIIRMNGLIQDVREQSRRAEEARKETDILASLSKKANEATDLEQVSQGLFDYLRTTMQLEDFALFVVDQETSELFVAAWDTRRELGEAGDWLRNVRLKLEPDLGTLYRTYQKKKTTYIPRFIEGFSAPGDNLIVGKLQLTSVLQVPLTIHDEVIGFFVCGPRRTLRLSREEIRTIERFCNQVAGAVRATALLDTSRKAQETAESARAETEILASLSRQANETTSLTNLCQGVFDVMRESLGLDFQGLFIVDDKETELIPVHLDETTGKHWEPEFRVPLRPDGGTLYKTWQRKRSTYLPRLPLEGAAEPDLEIVRKLGISAVLQIPLIVSDRVVAIFACGPTRRLSKEEIRSAERYCQQIAGAVRVMALLQATQEAREEADLARLQAEIASDETETLATLAKEANETTNLQALSITLLDHLGKQFGITKLGIYVVDSESHELVPVAGRGAMSDEKQQQWNQSFRISLDRHEGTLVSTYRRQKSFYLKKIPASIQGKDREMVESLSLEAILEVPLVIQGQTVAIVAADPSRELTRADISSIERLCNQIAGAVRTTALLQATQEAREEAVASKEEAEVARAESDALLENVLPTRVARELKESGRVEPVYYDSVSVLFTDFVGFTTAAAQMSPAELIQELDGCFSQFDQVSRRNNMEKLKTIGDAYMCAAGLPVPDDGHAIDACLTALEFRSFMKQMAEVKGQLGFEFWQIRIGIHSGPVTAGVIGQNKFAYDIWGDTVNVASRMESSGAPGMVNISGATYAFVKDLFECEYRGKVQAKGKGEMDMYFVHRIKPELSADEEGLLPNAMFEMARTNLDFDEIEAMKAELKASRAAADFGEAGKAPGSRPSSGSEAATNGTQGEPGKPDNDPADAENDRRQSDRRTGSERRKHAGARPLSEIDREREGW